MTDTGPATPLNAAAPEWPALPRYSQWQDTAAALHMWTQIVGKIRLTCAPWLNHGWQVAQYVTARGLGTTSIPYGDRSFDIEFDFVDDCLVIRSSDGGRGEVALKPRSVADFLAGVLETLAGLGLPVTIRQMPNEVPEPVRFSDDTAARPYDAEAVRQFWRALIQVDRVFNRFRTGWLGKSSPVHFFWGSFDLAVTRFSGRTAPLHPGGFPNLPDDVTREAYSHEVSSAGFWPGGGGLDEAAFYAYAYPSPDSFGTQPVAPSAAYFHAELGEFILPYAAVQGADDPDGALLAFLQSTYDAAATAGTWNADKLVCPFGVPGVPRRVSAEG